MKFLRGVLILSCLLLTTCGGISEEKVEREAQKTQHAGASDPQVCTHDDEFLHVPKQGPSCRLPNGLWRVKLKDGSTVETRGPDPAHAGHSSGVAGSVSAAAATSAFVCALTSSYHGLVIYVVANDRRNRYSAMASTVRNYFQWAQDKLNAEYQEFGASASYKMACDGDGRLRVDNVQLPTSAGSTTFSSIISELRIRGYNSSLTQYWVWYDGGVGSYCGQATFSYDDRADVNNANNSGNAFAITYGCDGVTMMHENGHSMGAVQQSAPNSSGAAHCNDGQDVMCYADGGPSSHYKANVCADHQHFDCDHDDYMHPDPPPGSYLATHWNIGACYNRFIKRSGCGSSDDLLWCSR